MIFKIYLAISLTVVVLFALYNLSLANRAKQKYGVKIKFNGGYKDNAGVLLSWIKMIVISFIPIYNIIMLIILVFFQNKITEKTDCMINEMIEKEEN